jgi:hypothetical protein
MPKELNDEQVKLVQACIAAINEDDNGIDNLADQLDMDAEDRGLEDDQGNENESYESANDPVQVMLDDLAAYLKA